MKELEDLNFKKTKKFSESEKENNAEAPVAESAAQGSQSIRADKKTDDDFKMSASNNIQVAPREAAFFDSCQQKNLSSVRKCGKQGLNNLVDHYNFEDGSFFNLPSEIHLASESLLEDQSSDNGKKDGKPVALKKVNTFYTESLAKLNDQMMGVIVPGQIEMISRQDFIESQVATILDKFHHYAENQITMRKLLEDNLNQMRSLVEENASLRQEIFLEKQNSGIARSNQAPYIGPRKQALPENHNAGGSRGRGSRSRGRSNNNQSSRAPGGGAYADAQCSNNGSRSASAGANANANATENGGEMFGEEMFNDEGYTYPKRKKQGKNQKGDTDPETDIERLSNRERMARREVMILGIPAQTGKFSLEKEAELVEKAFEELEVAHLKHQGVDIDFHKEVAYAGRLEEHFEAGDGTGENAGNPRPGCPPIKLRFHNEKKASEVLKAAREGGCLRSRRIVYKGLYAEPRKKDRFGQDLELDQEKIDRAKNRPTFFFRPSVTKEKRAQFKKDKDERNENKETRKAEDEKWKEKRETARKKTLFFGNGRNFDACALDERNKERVEKMTQRKAEEVAEKARKKEAQEQKEKDKLIRLNANILAQYPNLGAASANQLRY